MGAWDEGNFDNDDAMDFLIRLTEQDSLQPVEESLDAILAVDGYIDVDYGGEAVAAAEVVAMLRGKPASVMPESLATWHQTHQLGVDDALTTKAILAVEKATTDPKISELAGLWEEGGEEFHASWYSHITDLLKRLQS